MSAETDIAGLAADVRNICRTQDEMRGTLGDFDKKLDDILLQTTKTNGRVNALEKHRDEICSKHGEAIDGINKKLWILSLLVFSGGGAAGAGVMKAIEMFSKVSGG